MRALLERLLHLPPAPHAPPGDEATARVFRAAPKYFKYRFVVWCIGSAFLLFALVFPLLAGVVAIAFETKKASSSAAAGALVFTLFSVLVLLFVVAARLVGLLVLRLDYERRWYVVTDRSLRIREGVWIVREMTITFANIQNLAISQGPIQRALGLFDLRVETAGGGGGVQPGKGQPGMNLHTACFRGIENAAEIKELIQQRLRALKDSGLGDHEELHATSIPSPAASSFLDALRAVHEEARALRVAAES